jgi:hypothetical protein
MARSRYDELHDRFFPILSSKEGTRYERLAAVVLKALDEKNVVIHDFKLRGMLKDGLSKLRESHTWTIGSDIGICLQSINTR